VSRYIFGQGQATASVGVSGCTVRYGQTTVCHLGDKCFERAIVDSGQWQFSDVWVDPFFEAALTIPMLLVQLVCACDTGYGPATILLLRGIVRP
jgi:hypothetical protein